MTKEERKARERADRAEYILDCAESLMKERGFDNVRIEDIAEKAGYTKRSIYLYYRDRNSIYYSLVHRGQKILLSHLEAAAEVISSEGNLVRHFSQAFYDFSLSNPDWFELVMDYESRSNLSLEESDPQSPEARCRVLSEQYGSVILRSIIKDRERENCTSDLTPKQLLLILWSQIYGFMQVLITRRNRFEETYGITAEEMFGHFTVLLEKSYRGGCS